MRYKAESRLSVGFLLSVAIVLTLFTLSRVSSHAGSVPVNLALGKVATASTSYFAANGQGAFNATNANAYNWGSLYTQNPELVVDGNTSANTSRWASLRARDDVSAWSTAASGTTNRFQFSFQRQWLKIDLEAPARISEIRLYWEAAFAGRYKVLGSLDNLSWFDIDDITATSQKFGDNPEVIAPEKPVTAQYVMVQCLEKPAVNNNGYSIYEVEIFGEPTVLAENLALGKTMTASTVYKNGGGVEQTDTRGAHLAADGDRVGANSRWAAMRTSVDGNRPANAADTQPVEWSTYDQWLQVDLAMIADIGKIDVYWEAAYAAEYELQGSMDGESWFVIAEKIEPRGVAAAKAHSFADLSGITARFIRVHCLTPNIDRNAYSIYELEVFGQRAELSNMALNKPATATAGGMSAGNALNGVSRTQDDTSANRWESGGLPTVGANWSGAVTELTVDIGENALISNVEIEWADQFAVVYRLWGSADGVDYFLIADARTHSAQNGGTRAQDSDRTGENALFAPPNTVARYVKLECVVPYRSADGYGLYEMSVNGLKWNAVAPEPEIDAKTLAETVTSPPILNDQGMIVLPSFEGFTTTLYGSDNKQVLALDGTFQKPLVDMDVNVLYRFTSNEDPEDTAVSKADINFIVEGLYEPEANDNPVPDVLPAIREWKGNSGEFSLLKDSAITYDGSAEAKAAAEKIRFYFAEMLGKDYSVGQVAAKTGDIELILDAARLRELGDEGYYVNIDDRITITAPTEKALMYGGITVTQILSQSQKKATALKGVIRDYPKFPVRAGMVDVGRMYIPIEYLEEMGIYMAYYKMNELQVHLNDFWGSSNYSAFRLQSERYPGITATDGFYTKDEYRAFQKSIREFGIDVISEIDTPYHAESFRDIEGITMINSGQMEIRTEPERTNVVNVITNLFDEYLTGSDPVFVGKKVHVGTDEYLDNTAQAREAMRDYTNRLIEFVNNYNSEAHPEGLEARVWASLGGGGARRGFTGTTPVSNDAVLNLWAPYWAGAEYTYELGSDVINTYGGYLYIVPGANAGYPDRWNGFYQNNNYNLDFLYDSFDVNKYNATRNASQGGTGVLPIAHPRSVGAQFCVWNDMTSFYGGISEFDVFDRMRDAVMLLSEKTWFGEKTEGQTAEGFIARAKKLGIHAPGANPGRFVDSKTDVVAEFDFRSFDAAQDISGNGYHAALVGHTASAEGLSFDGDGAVSLPFDAIGYPYTTHIRFRPDAVPANAVLFSGKDGTLYANYNGTGHIGFERGTYGISYTFEFMTGIEPVITEGEWVSLSLVCGQKDIVLYVNGEGAAAFATSLRPVINNRQRDSDTFVMPLESVFKNIDGTLSRLKIYNRTLSDTEILLLYEEETQTGFIANPGEINVSGSMVNAMTTLANYSQAEEVCYVLLAVYSAGKLTDVDVQTINVAPGERLTVKSNAEGFGADSTSKLMVWDKKYVPLCPATERGQKVYYENLALNASVRASSVQEGNEVQNAVNSDRTDRWAASDGTFPQWLEIDLGAVCEPDNLNLFWFTAAGTPRVYKYKIWGRTEPITDWHMPAAGKRDFAAEGYSLLADRSGNQTTAHTTDTFNNVSVRYIVIEVVGANGGFASLYSVEAEGVK